MQTLKKIISRYMRLIACALMAAALVVVVYIQVKGAQRQAYEYATRTFAQIEQLLVQNQRELSRIQEEYSRTCLHNAQAIAYIVQNDPAILESVEELKKIAEFIEVDEIHIFDDSGRIYAGTHPEYYDYTFDSGEQMMFFKPMLEDRSLKLVQQITPNTAEAKLMQYSALWSKNQEFIVQVGMEPINVMKATQKNELSYLFSLFRVNPEADYYAIDIDSGIIVGSTKMECVGNHYKDVGFEMDGYTKEHEKEFYAAVNGKNSYCVFKKVDSNYIGRVISIHDLYGRIPATTFTVVLCLIAIAVILTYVVSECMNRYVVSGIQDVNEKLHRIAQGDLDEIIDIRSSVEFSQLSNYINIMKNALLDNSKKMSYVLSKTNMYIGVYQYSEYMKRVRFTEHIPRIFSLEEADARKLSADCKVFKEFIDQLRGNPVLGEPGTFQLGERYIKLEETDDEFEIFGVVIDVTEEIIKRKKIENERDIDLLTGLFNRRGWDTKIAELLHEPEKLAYSGFVMIDADNLKGINDTYGHKMGDVYLKTIAGFITGIHWKKYVAARLGGDEFILFLYQYDDEEELQNSIDGMERMQEDCIADLSENISVPLRFSFGCCMVEKDKNYQDMLKEADEKMYEYKRRHKQSMSAKSR